MASKFELIETGVSIEDVNSWLIETRYQFAMTSAMVQEIVGAEGSRRLHDGLPKDQFRLLALRSEDFLSYHFVTLIAVFILLSFILILCSQRRSPKHARD